jgi:hypothetical protein
MPCGTASAQQSTTGTRPANPSYLVLRYNVPGAERGAGGDHDPNLSTLEQPTRLCGHPLVNGAGLVCVAGKQLSVGYELAGQRVTLRMDGTQMTAISHNGELLRTLPCPIPAADRHRLRGARRAASTPAPSGPVVVQRRVSERGSVMVARQKIQVGMIHARKIVTVTATDHSFQLSIDGETVDTVPRTTASEVHRYKAYATRIRCRP